MPVVAPATRKSPRHTAAVIALHWLSVACLLVAVVAVLSRNFTEAQVLRQTLLTVHRQAGLGVLVLWVLRLALRLMPHAHAEINSPASAWELWVARGVHISMYLILAALPLLGWALSDARGQHLQWLGWLPLPQLTLIDPDAAEALEGRHVGAAWLLLGLVLVHVAAALWHHWVRHDGVLRSMWPSRPRSRLSAQPSN